MVNNFDRMDQEIRRFAAELSDGRVEHGVLVELLLEVVDLEDQHRVRSRNINKEVDQRVRSVAADMVIRGA